MTVNNEDKILQILGELKADATELKAGQARLETRVSDLSSGVTELKAGQARLETRVSDLSSDATELKAGQFEIRDNLTVINKNVVSIWGHLIKQNSVLSEIQGK
jgi:uncharacterized phage infection (PIP) family protein YhgE